MYPKCFFLPWTGRVSAYTNPPEPTRRLELWQKGHIPDPKYFLFPDTGQG